MGKKQRLTPAYLCFHHSGGIALGVSLPRADCAGAKVRQTGNGAQDAI